MSNTPQKCKNCLAIFAKKLCACWCGRDGCFCTDVCSDEPYFDLLKVSPGECLVTKGFPCSYFRKCVLPPEGYKYGPENLQELREAYAIIDPKVQNSGKLRGRRCPGINGIECGEPLLPRKRLCEKCRNRKRKNAYRKQREK